MSAQARAVITILELAREGGAGPAAALMIADGSVTLEFAARAGAVRIHTDGRVDQIWRDGDGLHSQFGERPLAKEAGNDVGA